MRFFLLLCLIGFVTITAHADKSDFQQIRRTWCITACKNVPEKHFAKANCHGQCLTGSHGPQDKHAFQSNADTCRMACAVLTETVSGKRMQDCQVTCKLELACHDKIAKKFHDARTKKIRDMLKKVQEDLINEPE